MDGREKADRTWIEAALNGPWGRERQPLMPLTVAEIVADALACAAEGAAIIHVHAYDAESGRQRDDWEIYARIIEGVRTRSDALVYPTIPLAGSGFASGEASPAARFAHVEELARRGLIEWAVVDPGSVNFTRHDESGRREAGFVYLNPEEHIREGLRICAAAGLVPSYAIYEPGFTRAGAALAGWYPGLPCPIYRFMFTDGFAWGFPPRETFLDAHLALKAQVAPRAPWMAAGLWVDLEPVIDAVLARGGHLRTGLEDAPWGAGAGNVALVRHLVSRVRASGNEVATPGEVRAATCAEGRERA